MNVFKRSILYLNRNKGRCILIFILLFCLIFSFVLGFSVFGSCYESAQKIIDMESDSFDLSFNRVFRHTHNAYTEYANVIGGNLTTVQIEEVCGHESVETFNAYKKVFMDTSLDLYNDDVGENSNAYFYAVNETKLHDFFLNGALELISGRHIEREDKNVCIISDDLSFLNNLEVGDIIYPKCTEATIKVNGEQNKIIVDPYPMEIVGIYKINFDYAAPDDAYAYELPQNMIFADHFSTKLWQNSIAEATNTLYFSNVEEYDKVTFWINDSKPIDTVMFNVKNPSKLSNFSFYDDNYVDMQKNDSTYHSVVNVLNSVSTPAVLVTLVAVAALLILLLILSSKFGKSRKKEDCILIRSGFAKKQVFAQRIIETGIIALAAFVFALLLASLLIEPISDGIKAADAARVFEPYTYEYIRAEIQFGPEITQNGYLPEDFEITLSSSAVIWGIVAVFIVTIISALVSSSDVLKNKTLDRLR